MTDKETKVTMSTEEAIQEMNSLQLKQNKELKQLQETLDTIQAKMTTDIEEINDKMNEELKNINDKLTSQTVAVNTELNTGLTNMKKDMAELMAEHMQKFKTDTTTTQEEATNTWKTLLQEIKEMKHNIAEIKNCQSNDEHSQQLDNHQNATSFSSSSQQIPQDHNISSPILNTDALSMQMNCALLNNNRMQTIFIPATNTAPVFHGKSTERPWQFLIRIEEYAESVHMWGEEMLLRGISQFLKDTALDWYCQLRRCNYLPKTWVEFKEAFVKQFNSPIRMAQHKQEWKECKQNKDETINEFIIRLRALWVDQFPNETEPDLIKHLFCKMRPDMLNIMGCPKNNSLQEILFEAQRVEEIIYQREKQNNTNKKIFNNPKYDNDNHYKNNNSTTKTNLSTRANDRTTYQDAHQQTQTNQGSQQQIFCYNCGKPNHTSRNCWYKQQNSNADVQQTTSASKNE